MESPVFILETVNTIEVSAGASNFSDGIATKVKSSEHGKVSDNFNSSFSGSDMNMHVTCEESIRDSPDYDQFFQEGYCKASVDCHESAEVTTDVDCSSPSGREKSDEDGDNDDMLGDIFDFSEEGTSLKQLPFNFISTLCVCMYVGIALRNVYKIKRRC